MKTRSRAQKLKPYLFRIVGGAVLINPAYAQEPASPVLEEVIVTGMRSSLEQSLDIKRDSFGVVDAISAEDIGKFPDTNLAESLQRITGISIDRRNGEGARVTARGFGPEYNLVTLNGRQVPGADGFSNGDIVIGGNGSGTRSFNFAQIASEAVRTVEVFKTSRADIPSGGIGATIDISTARPLDTTGMLASVGVMGIYDDSAPFSSNITPELSGIFSYSDEDGRWGVGVNGSYQRREGGAVQSTVNAWNMFEWDGTSSALRPDAVVTNAPATGQLYGIPNDIRYAFSEFERERVNGQAVVQFAPIESVTLTLDYTYAQNELEERRGEQTMWLNRNNSFTEMTFDTGDEPVATPVFLRDLVGGKDFGFEQQHNFQKNTLKSLGFNAKWQVTDTFSLALDLHDTNSDSKPNDPVTKGASSTAVSVAGTNCAAGECVGNWTQDFTFNNGLPIAARTFYPTPADAVANTNGVANPAFGVNQVGSQMLRVWSTEQLSEVQEARLDGSLDFDEGRLQFGVDTRKVEMRRRNGAGEAVLGDWGANDAGNIPGLMALMQPFSLTGLFNDFNTQNAAPSAWRGNATQMAQWAMNGPYPNWNSNNTTTAPGVLSADPALDNDNTIKEEVNAAYVQFSFSGSIGEMPTNVRLGVRYEQTDITSTSSIAIPTGLVWSQNNDFQVARSTELLPYSEKADYDHVLPSIDFDIGLTDTLKGRVSYSKTIARPEYGNLYAGATVNNATGSVLIDETTRASATDNNPALVPLESDNIDLSLEWYFSESGYVAVTFWEKRVNNFVGTAPSLGSLYGIRDQTSGPDAQSALAFLTSPTCTAQVTAAGNDVAAACSANDTALFTALAMLRNAAATGGLAAYDGGTPQVLDMEARFDILANESDPLYEFAVQRPVNQESAKIHGWELGGQYFLGNTGFGVQANYTIVDGDVSFDDTALGTAQFALLGLSDTANLVLMYEKFGISARLAYNWRDEFLTATNQNGSNLNPFYVEAYEQFDLSLGYDFGESLQGLSLQAEVINLTGEDVRWHARSSKQMVRLEDQSPRYMLGARYRF